jgi:hypothetical protein
MRLRAGPVRGDSAGRRPAYGGADHKSAGMYMSGPESVRMSCFHVRLVSLYILESAENI